MSPHRSTPLFPNGCWIGPVRGRPFSIGVQAWPTRTDFATLAPTCLFRSARRIIGQDCATRAIHDSVRGLLTGLFAIGRLAGGPLGTPPRSTVREMLPLLLVIREHVSSPLSGGQGVGFNGCSKNFRHVLHAQSRWSVSSAPRRTAPDNPHGQIARWWHRTGAVRRGAEDLERRPLSRACR